MPIPDETEAAKAVWDVYYANHQAAENFKHLKVLDCFMGGGTTLVEGSRLGFQVSGVDLNPVAWFVVKNELACTDPDGGQEVLRPDRGRGKAGHPAVLRHRLPSWAQGQMVRIGRHGQSGRRPT